LCQIDLTIATLADLGQNLKVVLTQAGATLAKMGTLATQILEQGWLVIINRGRRRIGVGGPKLGIAGLAVVNITKQVKVMVEKV
jgi:hypothetical protein